MKKMNNKGFSMVELIIVIAIMAILAAALAPALIKYIAKSRLSTDIQTASTIATAVNTALANENDYDKLAKHDKKSVDVATLKSDSSAFKETVGDNGAGETLKSKKCLDGTDYTGAKFMVTIDLKDNKIVVTEDKKKHQFYPQADKCLTDSGEKCNAK